MTEKQSMQAIIEEAARLREETDAALRDAHRALTALAKHRAGYDGLLIRMRRAGFLEACDRLGLPAADTPMERIALAGGNVKWKE